MIFFPCTKSPTTHIFQKTTHSETTKKALLTFLFSFSTYTLAHNKR